MANGRCPKHGGKSPPPGPGHPRYKHGMFSKARRAREAFEAAMDDPDLLDVRKGAALMQAGVEEAAERLEELDTPELRRRAMQLLDESFAATQPGEANAKLMALRELLEQGTSEDRAFRDLIERGRELQRAIESAWRIKLHAAQAINGAELATTLHGLLAILSQEVGPEPAARVLERFDREQLGGSLAARGIDLASGGEGGRSLVE